MILRQCSHSNSNSFIVEYRDYGRFTKVLRGLGQFVGKTLGLTALFLVTRIWRKRYATMYPVTAYMLMYA